MFCGVWRYSFEGLTVWPLLLISHKYGSGSKLKAMLYFFFFRKQRRIGASMKTKKKDTGILLNSYCTVFRPLFRVKERTKNAYQSSLQPICNRAEM